MAASDIAAHADRVPGAWIRIIPAAIVLTALVGYAWLVYSIVRFVPLLAVIPLAGLCVALSGAIAFGARRYLASAIWLAIALVLVVIFSLVDPPHYWAPANEAFGPDFSSPPMVVTPLIQASWISWHLLPIVLALAVVLALAIRKNSRRHRP